MDQPGGGGGRERGGGGAAGGGARDFVIGSPYPGIFSIIVKGKEHYGICCPNQISEISKEEKRKNKKTQSLLLKVYVNTL